MSEGVLYIYKGYKYIDSGNGEYYESAEVVEFTTATVIKQRKGWFKIYPIGNYHKKDGVWKRRDFGPGHFFPVMSGRKRYDGLVNQENFCTCFWNPITDTYINIVNTCEETFLKPLYS